MKAAATSLDVQAVRVVFALEAEEWYVEQFGDLGYSTAHLRRYLEQPAPRATGKPGRKRIFDRILTNEERDRLQGYLDEVRKVREPGQGLQRLDGKPRNDRGQPREDLSNLRLGTGHGKE